MLENITIMIVDDDREICDSVRFRLHRSGYCVTSACDGQDALEKISVQRPDAVIMDSRMPRRDGMSALIELKSRRDTQHIPVVMVSASVIDKSKALDAGARFFIAKPYNAADLLHAIRVSLSERLPEERLLESANTHTKATN